MPALSSRLGLTPGQMTRLVLLGVVLWLMAALLLRMLGPLGVYEGWARVALYLLIIPGTLPFILVVGRITGIGPGRIGIGWSLMTAVATMLDGLALGWFPTLYGADVTLWAGAGGTILWGAGTGLILAFLLNRPEG